TRMRCSGGKATIYGQTCAGDVGGFRTDEVGHQTGDLIALAESLHRKEASQLIGKRSICRVHVGVDGAGLDIVDGDAARPEVARQPTCETRNRRLGHGIDAPARESNAVGIDAANGYDASALAQMAGGFLDGGENTTHIYGHHAVKIIKGELVER